MDRHQWAGWGLGAAGLVITGLAVWSLSRERPPPAEVPVRVLALSGPVASPRAELSGLAWHDDDLVLLPQFPAAHGDAVFAIARADIEARLDGRAEGPLPVRPVPFEAPSFVVERFDGFEAIAIDGDDVWVAIERERRGDEPVGLLARGRVIGGLERIEIADVAVPLPPQNDLPNVAYEAIVVREDRVIALYETNGSVNPRPRALAFARDLADPAPVTLRMEPIEYRVTDATGVDERGRFWVTNYRWPDAPWDAGTCSITERYGSGPSHARCRTVERLVELRVERDRVEPSPRPPIQLELLDDPHARNWEGIVRLGDRGFLLVTDEHPETILAFVALPSGR